MQPREERRAACGSRDYNYLRLPFVWYIREVGAACKCTCVYAQGGECLPCSGLCFRAFSTNLLFLGR